MGHYDADTGSSQHATSPQCLLLHTCQSSSAASMPSSRPHSRNTSSSGRISPPSPHDVMARVHNVAGAGTAAAAAVAAAAPPADVGVPCASPTLNLSTLPVVGLPPTTSDEPHPMPPPSPSSPERNSRRDNGASPGTVLGSPGTSSPKRTGVGGASRSDRPPTAGTMVPTAAVGPSAAVVAAAVLSPRPGVAGASLGCGTGV